nr:alpha/beta hydrolase [Bdellovibrio sp. HAGR004]
MKKDSTDLSGQIDKDDFNLRFVVQGQGLNTLVLGSSVFYPRTFSQSLRQHLRLGFVDYRGFAATAKPFNRTDYELGKICQDTEDLRQACGFTQSVVVGHSAHGYLALEYARRYPKSVSQVVMICTGPSHGAPMNEAFRRWEETIAPERKAQFALDQTQYSLSGAESGRRFITYCQALNAKSWFDPHFDASPLWQDVKANDDAMDYLYGEVFRDYDTRQALQEISAPILLICGLHDYGVAPFWTWNELRNTSPNFTVKVFEKSGHYPQLEESQVFDLLLRDWLSSNTP